MINAQLIGTFCVAFAAMLWGFDQIVLTPRLYNLDLNFVVFMLHLIPFILMNFLLFSQIKKIKEFTLPQIALLTAIAFFGGILGTLSIVKAIFLVQFNGLSVVALLQKLQPVIAISLAHIFLKEKPNKYFVFVAPLAIIASYFLIFGLQTPHFENNSSYIQAIFFALIAAVSFGSATVLGKLAVKHFDFQTVTYYRFGITAFLMFFVVLLTGKITLFSQITPLNWMIFFIIAFTSGSGALFLYYYGLRKITAMNATLSELMFPVSTIFFDYMINDVILSPVQIVAACVIVGSVILMSMKR